ncbi:MAG: TIGR03767 family metallophosphoesterase [Acidimicrobiales bacterium]
MAAATGLPRRAVAETLLAGPAGARRAVTLTTLSQTLMPGAASPLGYRLVVTGGGERHHLREELAQAQPGREGRRRSLLAFTHLTDQHIIDVQSTTRVEFLDRYSNGECRSVPFTSAHRPGEAACARVADAMLRRLRDIGVSPVTGAPLAATICTGDNTDNQQQNELEVFLGVMDGGLVSPQSGNPRTYEGVQASGDVAYWHPDPAVADLYKEQFGFPGRPGFLEEALAPFQAVGAGVPWYSCYGNHDGLQQGNSPVLPGMQAFTTGPLKPVGAPPGSNPCDVGEQLGALPAAPATVVTADPNRRFISRDEWIEGHLASTGAPRGHGFSEQNAADGTAYYVADVGPLRWIVLDTVNPGGYASGSVGDRQLAWLDAELSRADDERQLVVLFSHHGLRSLDNPSQNPDPNREPGASDLPRHTSGDVFDVIGRHPSVIAWVNGHTHKNVIEAQTGFWEIGTAAHVDWPPQSRIVEVVDNHDGSLSIFTTMVDHEGNGLVDFARELIANDPQGGFGKGDGEEVDRNTELLIGHPFPEGRPGPAPAPGAPGAVQSGGEIPATGLPDNLTIGGALLLAGAIGVHRLRERATSIHRLPPDGPVDRG